MNRREEEIAQQVGPSRVRHGEEPPYIEGLASPAITGYFTEVTVPSEIPVGDDIKVTIGFYAINPGALYWATFLVADCRELNIRKMLEKTREVGQEGGRKKTYTIGKMSDKEALINFNLFAHEDANHQWDWGEYERWLYGIPVEITHLDWEYRFVSPGAPPEPPPAKMSGVITRVEPLEFALGQPVDLEIDFNAYVETIWEQIKGWDTRLTATLDSMRDSDIQTHIGRDGSRTGETLNLGAMPNRNLSGTLVLEGRGKNILGLPTAWVELDRTNLYVTVTGKPPPECRIDADCPPGYVCQNGVCVPEGEPPPGKEFPWLPVALIGGGAVVAAAALIKPKKGKA